MLQLTKACELLLYELVWVISAVTDKDFCTRSTALGGSTIGQHVRHTIEFFYCLKEGMRTGVVNYDNRAHDRKLEIDRFLSINALGEVERFVGSVQEDVNLTLEVGYGRDSDNTCSISTSFHRELAYNIEHLVHHMAIVRIGLRDVATHVRLPADFGVAASTMRYRSALHESGFSNVGNIADHQVD